MLFWDVVQQCTLKKPSYTMIASITIPAVTTLQQELLVSSVYF